MPAGSVAPAPPSRSPDLRASKGCRSSPPSACRRECRCATSLAITNARARASDKAGPCELSGNGVPPLGCLQQDFTGEEGRFTPLLWRGRNEWAHASPDEDTVAAVATPPTASP